MASEKVVAIMLILAVVLSILSIAITLNTNSSINNTGAGSLPEQDNAGNVQLVVENSAAETNGGNAAS
ncbi:hypothetical protein HYT92_01130 [Candidatus Pacearchaeota archaeon]|nr:hypothetical protein [Candidatus Pacearchaeota archaeon]